MFIPLSSLTGRQLSTCLHAGSVTAYTTKTLVEQRCGSSNKFPPGNNPTFVVDFGQKAGNNDSRFNHCQARYVRYNLWILNMLSALCRRVTGIIMLAEIM